MKPVTHHAHLMQCRECARLELGLRMAKTDHEKEQWRKLIAQHKGEVYQPQEEKPWTSALFS